MKTFQKIMGKIVNLLIILVIIAIIFCLYFIISIKVFHKQYINFFGYSIFEVATGSQRLEWRQKGRKEKPTKEEWLWAPECAGPLATVRT